MVSPGALVLTKTSVAQLVRAEELARFRRDATINAAGLYLADDPDWRLKGLPARAVTEWSAKSRANMVKTLASLDWSPLTNLEERYGRVAAMVTLTYPGAWEVVAADGDSVKVHVAKLLKRYSRTWGEPFIGAWKLEFQDRGAPHVHMFMAPPHGRARQEARRRHEKRLAEWEAAGLQRLSWHLAMGERWGEARRQAMRDIGPQPRWREADGDGLAFRQWLSLNWANVVAHPDPDEYVKHLAAGTAVDYAEGLKCTDPKRLAVYFGKHGQYRTKEYQHIVPEPWSEPGNGPGRFWGYWGLKPAVVPVDLRSVDYVLAARIMRRYAERIRVWDKQSGQYVITRAMQPAKRQYRVVDQVTGEISFRRHRRRSRQRRFTSCSGFLLANDAPSLAKQLARAIEVCRQ